MNERAPSQIIVIVQARMGSTRLQGKTLKKVGGRPLFSYQLERLKRCKTIDKIVVATTERPEDVAIEDLCKQESVACFRGSDEDVLARYYFAAKTFGAGVVVRVTGDCPLIDPAIVDHVVNFYLSHDYDYVSNTLKSTYPRGMDVEVFSFALLKEAFQQAKTTEEREHVTPYFYWHPERFVLGNVAHHPSINQHRWTVDTEDDFVLIEKLLEALYPTNPIFTMSDILNQFQLHPDWFEINSHVLQKKLSKEK